ncbi:MAG: DHH family phosphoesterase [Halobacteriaceae archaeon]
MGVPVPALADQARQCAAFLTDSDNVLCCSHIDADGLTSAAIASTALERAEVRHDVAFFEQLDDAALEAISDADSETVLFTDFGSGQLDQISEFESGGKFTPVIIDHHQPCNAHTRYHLNPMLVGIDGASELSGAGATYVLARAMEENYDNRDLAKLAVVGAVGDMQSSEGKLHGANEAIVEEGETAGVLESGPDLNVYGKQTRSLPKLLEYATDISIPGITGHNDGAVRFLNGLDIDIKNDGEWRTWSDLEKEERQTLVSALLQHGMKRGIPTDKLEALVGTGYTLLDENEGTELRDASEFSTLLNATARYDRADIGLAVCLGNRDKALRRARQLLQNHRRALSEGVSLIQEKGVTEEESLQWFHAKDNIRDTIVGIVAGMAIGNQGVDADKPIIAFANKNDEEIKVSSRGTPPLIKEGLDLSKVMSGAASEVGGDGGGHDIAAGATVPAGEERAFIEAANEIISSQLH